MDALIEVHDEWELTRALRLDAGMIGINNRDLKTFDTDIDTAIRLARLIPSDCLVVAESGLATPDDLRTLEKADITTYLIGESLMHAADVEAATRALLEGAA
jgi:indole-3-glycerol phosphate synthase